MVKIKNHMSTLRPLNSLDRAYPAQVRINMLMVVPNTVLVMDVSMAPLKLELLNVFT
ncbi:hypothetical protein D3C76_1621570 [compost metagenome]